MRHESRSPKDVDQQSAPEPERMVTPDEEAGMDLAELEEPPQAEGRRDAVEEGRRGQSAFTERRKNEGAD